MQQQLINHNPDLKRLEEEGYEMEIIGGQYLVVRHIPYVNPDKQIMYGSIVCTLTLVSPTRASCSDHTVYFIGETPCESSGIPLFAIINNSQPQHLTAEILVNHYFSSKPPYGNYKDYHDKIRTYAEILCAQARAIDPSVTPRPKRQKFI